ncbi:hypothetical protein G6F57_018382 [Rhizopus arrhizus]|nr:hypothetical protein G6F57_018382 [Rhizopus arrhizus]
MRDQNVVVEPGDMLVLRTGFAERLVDMNGQPDPHVLEQTGARGRRPLRGQLRRGVLSRAHIRPRPFDPAAASPLPVQAGRAAGGTLVPERPGRLAARAGPQPLPADRSALAHAGRGGLPRDADRHGVSHVRTDFDVFRPPRRAGRALPRGKPADRPGPADQRRAVARAKPGTGRGVRPHRRAAWPPRGRLAAQLRGMGGIFPGLRAPGRRGAGREHALSRAGSGRHPGPRASGLAGVLAGLQGHRFPGHS